jgi:hypothetical protein
MMDDEFDDRDLDTIRDITSRLGLADVREFGLTWEDCEGYLASWFDLAPAGSTILRSRDSNAVMHVTAARRCGSRCVADPIVSAD